jgi:hypothetical protein
MTAQSSTASSILFAMTRDEYPDYDLELMGTPPYSGTFNEVEIFSTSQRKYDTNIYSIYSSS